MLGFFVQPQPDETLYSIFARYGQRVQYPGRLKLLHELTGSLNPINLNFFLVASIIFSRCFRQAIALRQII